MSFKEVLKFALVLGLIQVTYLLIKEAWIDKVSALMVFEVITLVILLLGIVLVLNRHQNKLGRPLGLLQGLGVGVTFGVTVGVMFVLYGLIKQQYLVDMLDIKTNEDYLMEQLKSEGKPEIVISRRIEEMRNQHSFSQSAISIIAWQIGFSTLFTLLTLLFLKLKADYTKVYKIKD